MSRNCLGVQVQGVPKMSEPFIASILPHFKETIAVSSAKVFDTGL